MEKRYLGIDIGGTAVKLGVVTDAGLVLDKTEASVSFDRYQTPILTTVLAAAADFAARQAPGLAGIGVSATGQIDTRSGRVAGTCGSLPGWAGSEIRQALTERFALPVTVANDANCVCLGEAWVGAARGCTDVVCVTLGTGVGGGILTGGRLLEGSRGLGGELGHFPVHAGGAACTCGNTGCWERYASTSALVRTCAALDPALDSGRRIFAAARQGDAAVCRALDAWIGEIAAGLIGLVHLFNPQRILIGGGVSVQQELLIAPLEKRVHAGVMPAFAEGLTVQAAALGNDAGLVGAVEFFRRRQETGS
jgi:glucokinase